MARTILVEASPANASTGAIVPVALAGGGSRAYRHRSRNDWLAGVVSEPRFSAKIEFDQNGFSGGARPQLGPLEFFPSSPATLASLNALLWSGAAIEVFVGDDDLAVPTWTTILKGTVLDTSSRFGTLSFSLRDASAVLDDPAITDRFTGSGGLQGDSTVAERVKRRSFGPVFNVEARLLLLAYLIFEVGDPNKPLQSIDDVKDMGRSASSLVSVAWQGTAAATLAALIATIAPEGGGVIAPSIACVKWWTTPAGPLTVDFKGEIGSGYVETVASIAERIVQASSTLTIANVAAINAVRADPAGIHIDNGSETTSQALDRLLKGSSILWQARADAVIELSEIKLTGPVETVAVVEASRERSFKPVKNRRLGYQRNQREHSASEIAQIDGFLTWFQPDAPTYEESEEGQRWIDTDDGNREYIRTGGVIAIGSNRITIGGNTIILGWWRSISDTRIEATAITAAAAEAQATAALAELANIASDNILSAGEKPAVVLDHKVLTDERAAILAQASAFGVTTERTAYDSAVNALIAYLATLTTPTLWNDASGNTTIVGSTFRDTFAASYAARQTLLNKVADVAKSAADTAQAAADAAAASASSAITQISNIVSDSILDKSEKPDVVQRYNAILNEKAGIEAQATAYSITTEKTAYSNAVTALTSYLTGLSPAYNSYTTDTTVVRATFNSKFTDVYNARQTLLNKIAEVAGTRATWPNVRDSDPSAPDDNADVTANAQVTATLAGDKTVAADYLGAVTSENLAALIWGPAVVRGGTSIRVSNDVSYSLTDTYGGTFAVNNTNGSSDKGNVTISAITASVASGSLNVTVSGVLLPRLPFKVTKQLASAPPPASGTDSKTWDFGEFIAINTTSFAAITSIKTVALGSGQTLYGTATLDYNVAGTGGVSRTLTAKWQYSVAGANSWNDFAAGVTGTTAYSAFSGGAPNYAYQDAEPGIVTIDQTKAGLSAGNYDIRIVGMLDTTGRNVTSGPTALIEAKA